MKEDRYILVIADGSKEMEVALTSMHVQDLKKLIEK